jgi:hypothetical protein
MRRLSMILVVFAGLLVTASVASAHPCGPVGYVPVPRHVPHAVYRHGYMPHMPHRHHYRHYHQHRHHHRHYRPSVRYPSWGPGHIPYHHRHHFGSGGRGFSIYLGF